MRQDVMPPSVFIFLPHKKLTKDSMGEHNTSTTHKWDRCIRLFPSEKRTLGNTGGRAEEKGLGDPVSFLDGESAAVAE